MSTTQNLRLLPLEQRRFNDRVVFISGAGSVGSGWGNGRAMAVFFAQEGAKVWGLDVKLENMHETQSLIQGFGGSFEAKECDVTSSAAMLEAVNACMVHWGRIDVLINNAGILGEVLPVWETDPRNVRQVLDTNLFGTYLVTRAVTNVMREQIAQPMRGHIVNVSSIQGKEGMGLALAYSASKAGVMAMTKTVAKDTAALGIMVTAITPAAAETAMAREISQARRDEITSKIPMGRFVEIDEIARMVMWLSSDDCSFSTGGIFDLSGGRATY